MAECFVNLKEFDKALAEYDRMFRLQPRFPIYATQFYYAQADVYMAQGNFFKAIELYNKSIKNGGIF
jgi:tetratricopeptide (TPR) repeat protein